MNLHTEQEWQFSAPTLSAARDWLAAQPHQPGARRFEARPTLELHDTYYDSSDFMIFRAGFALRMRHALGGLEGDVNEITLKSLQPSRDGFARRSEFSEQVPGADIDSVLVRPDGIGERIRELVGARPLEKLFDARTRRERQQLLEADNELPLAEVDLDETSIETSCGTAQTLQRVEVECLNAEPAALSPWVEQLRTAARLEPVVQSKFRAGLAAAGLDPAPTLDLGPTDISASQSFADTQLALFRRYFIAVFDQEPHVRAGADSAVHAMRVAARHLEVLLRICKGFGPAWALSARGALRRLVKLLGAVRDCDVQLAHLEGTLASLEATERANVLPLLDRLDRRRRKSREQLLHYFDSPRTREWTAKWFDNLRAGTPGGPRAASASTGKVARDLIRAQARKLRKRADKLREGSMPDDYHEVRIRAKRLRYALDAFADLYGSAAENYARVLARLQNILGAFNDAAVRTSQFTELVSKARLPSSTSFLIGRMVERDVREFDRCRRQFPRAYRRLRRRRWRELLAAMDTAAGAGKA
jgi:CHAD domain-containing protein